MCCKLSFVDKYERITFIWSASLKQPRRGYNGSFERFTDVKANKLCEAEACEELRMLTDLISVFNYRTLFFAIFSTYLRNFY